MRFVLSHDESRYRADSDLLLFQPKQIVIGEFLQMVVLESVPNSFFDSLIFIPTLLGNAENHHEGRDTLGEGTVDQHGVVRLVANQREEFIHLLMARQLGAGRNVEVAHLVLLHRQSFSHKINSILLGPQRQDRPISIGGSLGVRRS